MPRKIVMIPSANYAGIKLPIPDFQEPNHHREDRNCCNCEYGNHERTAHPRRASALPNRSRVEASSNS